MAVPDMAMLGWRLWSLRADPVSHPLPRDSRLRLAAAGIRATVTHPFVSRRHKTKRVAWFVAASLAPGGWVDPVLRWYTPDAPYSTTDRTVRQREPSGAGR